MSNENKIRDAADAIKGIAEAVPIYQDIVQPSAKEIGTALQTVAKTIHVALAPLSALVWGYDRIKDYLHEALTERLKQVPPERIVTPNPSVAGPAVESLRFSANEPTLREMYANLLATAMDAKTVQEAHPAFVEMIRQLAPDEALILEYISSKTINRNSPLPPLAYLFPVLSGEVVVSSTALYTGVKYPIGHYSLLEVKAGCSFPQLSTAYINNLCRLGLTELVLHSEIVELDSDLIIHYSFDELMEGAQSQALEHYHSKFVVSSSPDYKVKSVNFYVKEQVLRLTSLGLQFCQSCVVNPERV